MIIIRLKIRIWKAWKEICQNVNSDYLCVFFPLFKFSAYITFIIRKQYMLY